MPKSARKLKIPKDTTANRNTGTTFFIPAPAVNFQPGLGLSMIFVPQASLSLYYQPLIYVAGGRCEKAYLAANHVHSMPS